MKIAKLGGILLIITIIAAGILGFANQKTASLIEKVNQAADNESRKQVFPEAEEFKDLDSKKLAEIKKKHPEVIDIYEAVSGGNVIGYTCKTATVGYAGPVEVITGVDTKTKKITGVRIGQQAETPGLGALATEPAFNGQYTGKPAEELTVVKSSPGEKDILAITGATITSRCVTFGVNIATEIAGEVK